MKKKLYGKRKTRSTKNYGNISDKHKEREKPNNNKIYRTNLHEIIMIFLFFSVKNNDK